MAKTTHRQACQIVMDVLLEKGPMRFRFLTSHAHLPLSMLHAAIKTLAANDEIHIKREKNLDIYHLGPAPEVDEEEASKPDVYHEEIAPGHRIVRFGNGYRSGPALTTNGYRGGASSLWTIFK